MQDAYVRAYQHLSEFEGRAKFSTWLTRIAVHEALARSRRRLRFQSLDNSEESNGGMMGSLASAGRDSVFGLRIVVQNGSGHPIEALVVASH
jgi:DNA-directed RNA polymerase specialized sigma24 family protein